MKHGIVRASQLGSNWTAEHHLKENAVTIKTRPIMGIAIGKDGEPQYYLLTRTEEVDEAGEHEPIILNTSPFLLEMDKEQAEHLHLQLSNVLGMGDEVRGINQELDRLETTGLSEFAITFGVQYNDSTNPHPKGMHPAGYFVIEAPDQETARAMAFALFDQAWAFDYPLSELLAHDVQRHHPRGELGRASINHNLTPKERIE